jgi:flagellar biosynthesis protein FlhG
MAPLPDAATDPHRPGPPVASPPPASARPASARPASAPPASPLPASAPPASAHPAAPPDTPTAAAPAASAHPAAAPPDLPTPAGPRALPAPALPPAIAVASGKGGVGKTFLAVNLSVALARGGLRVGLFDADVGLANASLLLGLDPAHSIAEVAAGQCALDTAVERGPAGVRLVSGGHGHAHLADLTPGACERLLAAMAPLGTMLDLLVIDTAPGLSAPARAFIASAALVLVVITPEPAAFMDAYALIKALAQENGRREFWVAANQVADAAEGRRLFDQFALVARRFLPVALDWAGAVPHDPLARKAALERAPLVELRAHAPAAIAITRLGARLAARLAEQAQAEATPGSRAAA